MEFDVVYGIKSRFTSSGADISILTESPFSDNELYLVTKPRGFDVLSRRELGGKGPRESSQSATKIVDNLSPSSLTFVLSLFKGRYFKRQSC